MKLTTPQVTSDLLAIFIEIQHLGVRAGSGHCLAWRVQSTTAPPVKLISLAVMVRAQSDAAKAAMLATSS